MLFLYAKFFSYLILINYLTKLSQLSQLDGATEHGEYSHFNGLLKVVI